MGVLLCGRCIAGEGGECHTPGCALWMNRAPDIPVTPNDDGGAVALDELLADDVIQAAHEAYLRSDSQAAIREAFRVATAKRGQ